MGWSDRDEELAREQVQAAGGMPAEVWPAGAALNRAIRERQQQIAAAREQELAEERVLSAAAVLEEDVRRAPPVSTPLRSVGALVGAALVGDRPAFEAYVREHLWPRAVRVGFSPAPVVIVAPRTGHWPAVYAVEGEVVAFPAAAGDEAELNAAIDAAVIRDATEMYTAALGGSGPRRLVGGPAHGVQVAADAEEVEIIVTAAAWPDGVYRYRLAGRLYGYVGQSGRVVPGPAGPVAGGGS